MDELELLDISDELLIINKVTIEKLFKEENQNPLILYMFYYKTAKWQKHNPIKASDDYCKKCLHWGIDKLQSAKKRLKELQLIESIKRTDDKGKIVGWYVKINYLIEKTTIPETTIPVSPQLVSQETNTINNNNINTINNINTNHKKEKYGTYKRISLTREEYTRLVEEFGEDFINKQIELLDEYVESNNNKNRYTNFNLVLRKSIRENWFDKTKKKEDIIPDWFNKDLDNPDLATAEEMNKLLEEIQE